MSGAAAVAAALGGGAGAASACGPLRRLDLPVLGLVENLRREGNARDADRAGVDGPAGRVLAATGSSLFLVCRRLWADESGWWAAGCWWGFGQEP